MRVAINGLYWEREYTGSGQYLRQLWAQIQQLNPEFPSDDQIEASLIVRAGDNSIAAIPASQQITVKVPAPVVRLGEQATKIWWEQYGAPRQVRHTARQTSPFDVIHYPYFASPWLFNFSQTATVLTIHDLIPLVMPVYTPSRKHQAYFRLVSQAARKATLIFADSEHTRQDILRLLKVAPNKVATVYLGTDEKFKPASFSPVERAKLLQKFGLGGQEQFIFYIGGFDIRKNIPMLLQAFAAALPRLKASEDPEHHWVLALAGKPLTDNPALYPDLEAVIRQHFTPEDAQRVRFLGRVSEEEKLQLYQMADLFVFPSQYEGFGLDPLDALACGVATICSNSSSLPELMGSAACLLPPDAIKEWSEAIIELATNPTTRQDLARGGVAQAAKFSWRKMTERTIELYHAAHCMATLGTTPATDSGKTR